MRRLAEQQTAAAAEVVRLQAERGLVVEGMICSCFLPTCSICLGPSRVAGPSASRVQPGCCCLLPGCASCSAPQQPTGLCREDREERLSSKGRTITPEMAAVIASVDDRLRAMLEGHADSKAYLQKGAALQDLLSSRDPRASRHASRHDHLVAHLCNVGVGVVQDSRHRVAAAHERGQLLPAAREQRGPKRKTVEMLASSQGHGEDVKEQRDDEEEISLAFKAAGYDTVHGVAGHYVQGAEGNAENHAIALVLGRLYVYALVMNIPDTTVIGILTLFRMAGIDIGQKHHHRGAISSFAGIVASMCIEGVAHTFADKLRNLQHPSCWRLIYDGVTLRNGVTVTVVLICFTSAEGDIEVEYLGCSRCGSRSDAAGSGQGIWELLKKTLKISDSNAVCNSRTGLRLAYVAASSQDHDGGKRPEGAAGNVPDQPAG